MKKLFTLTLSGVLMVCLFSLHAQDIHYSQFYASPLTLNPAQTGAFDGTYRIGGMYRRQWGSVDAHPFITPAVSFEYRNILQKLIKKGVLAAGIIVWNDQSGSGDLHLLNVQLSASYQYPLDAAGKHKLGFGLQTGFAQEGINASKLYFEDQFVASTGTFNQNLSSGEALNTSYSYVPLNLGLNYVGVLSNKLKGSAGIALFNVDQPKDGFLTNTTNKSTLPVRKSFNIGAEYKINDKVNLLPNLIYMAQAGSKEVNVGSLISDYIDGHPLDITVFAGLYFRALNTDALIPTVGAEYKGWRVGISYDINTSSLNTATGGLGGIEISALFIGNILGTIMEKQILTCPRF